MALTYQQSKLVKDTLPALREHGEQITTTFYRNMLRDHPELNNYFNSVNQKNGRQPRALTSVILNFASNINHMSDLIPKFERMCNKHCSLGIRPEHYDIVGKYLLRAFGEVLGPAMTTDVFAAWEKAYWALAKMLIGREAQLYKDFEGWTSWRRFKIDRVVPETEDVYSFYLVPEDGRKLPEFLPGQYVSLRVRGPEGYAQARQYSLSEAWRPDYYRISVKRDEGARYANSVARSYFHPGLVSNLLIDQMAPGSTVELSHPAGDFFLDVRNNTSTLPLVLISAGVGATPMVAIADTVAATQPGRPVSWIHGSRRSVPFEDHIARLRRSHGSGRGSGLFRTAVFKTRPAPGDDGDAATHHHVGRVDLARLDPHADLHLNNSGAEYYVCGPERFMMDVCDYLKAQGVAPARIKIELFSTGDLAMKRS
ncbi:globin-like protein [Corynascus novoguineensis]|uniref:nitric oxide dioxygenase n=1 Tax=Corynascus novoguineensis TaxID=1126955 RepID=A0AAN7CJ77_9PEZI|nr:globin-like protein [Corynascus novoguineensis]